MNAAKFESIQRDLTTTARKVFDATPIGEPWTGAQVFQELRRKGVNIDIRMVMGCLHSLTKDGLVQEPKTGSFIRTPVRQRAQPAPQPILTIVPTHQESTPMAKPATAEKTEIQPIDRLTALSDRARKMMSDLKDLASDIDNAAMEIAEQEQRHRADTEKLRALQALLKSLA